MPPLRDPVACHPSILLTHSPQVLNLRDPRQLGEQLHPRALRAIKDTVRGMRVAYRCPSGTVRNKLVREIGSRGASQVCVGWECRGVW